MGTLLTAPIYDELLAARRHLVRKFGAKNVSGIHLPWAGDTLINRLPNTRKLYVLGIATDKNYPTSSTFEQALTWLEKEWRQNPSVRSRTPFWQFLSGVTSYMFGDRYYDCINLWGWSNLYKIAYNVGSPTKWDALFYDGQRQSGARALTHEFAQLCDSVIFIGSNYDHQMLGVVLPDAEWDTRYNNDGVSFWKDDSSRKLYVWGYHPAHAQRCGFYDRMLERTKSLIASA